MTFKRNFFTIYLFLYCFIYFHPHRTHSAEIVKIDSLKDVVGTGKLADKYSALCELRQHFKHIDNRIALDYGRQVVIIARSMNDDEKLADALNDLAILYSILHRNDSALLVLNESMNLYEGLDDNRGIAKTYTNMGIAFSAQSFYIRAAESYFAAIKLFELAQDSSNLARVYLNLGQVFEKIGDPEQARKYFENALAMYTSLHDEAMIVNTSACLGVISNTTGDFNHAYDLISRAKDYYIDHGNIVDLGTIYTNLARVLTNMGNTGEAVSYYHKALQLAEQSNDKLATSVIFIDLAELYFAKARYDSTIYYLSKSRNLKIVFDHHINSRYHFLYSSFYSHKHQYREALDHYLLFSLYKDSIDAASRMRTIEELEIKFLSDRKTRDLEQVVKASTMNRNRQWVLAGFSLAGFIFSFLVMALLYQKRQSMARKKEIADLERIKLEQEKRIKDSELKEMQLERSLQEEEMAKIKAEMQLREQELVFQTLCRMDLAQVNKKVHERLLPFHINFSKKKDQDEFVRALNEITRESTRDSLADFEVTFTQLHHGFFERLLTIAPDMSKSEIMVCALLRLNLSSKDISRLLNLSLSTIDVTRHHIRKKLNLDAKDNLTAYLISI